MDTVIAVEWIVYQGRILMRHNGVYLKDHERQINRS